MKGRQQKQTGEKDGEQEERTEPTDQTESLLTASMSASPPSLTAAADQQRLELEDRRKSSRLSSMRHHTRKRIEVEHLIELQNKLKTLNSHLRQENEKLRNQIQQVREALRSKNARQGNQSTEAETSTPQTPNTQAPPSTSNADQEQFINNIVGLFEGLNDSDQLAAQYESQSQRQLGNIRPAALAHLPSQGATLPLRIINQPRGEATRLLRQSLELELIRQRLTQQLQQQHHHQPHLPYASVSTTPYPPRLPYAAQSTQPNSPTIQHSALNLLLKNYIFWQQQGAFGMTHPANMFLQTSNTGMHPSIPVPGIPSVIQGTITPEGTTGNGDDNEEEDSKPRAKDQA